MKQNKNLIIALAIGFLIIGGLAFWSRQNQGSGQNYTAAFGASTLQARESSFDFGPVSMAAGRVSHLFALKNSGVAPVTVRSLATSCMCTTAYLILGTQKFGPFGMSGMAYNPVINQIIPAAGEAQVEAIFDPAAHGPAGIGHVERQIMVQTSDNRETVLGFEAQVNP